jgi:UDP-3-O-[3-hydroxymyristoyl] glucosamine N-acyltransferase
VVIEDGVEIEEGSVIGSNSYIGHNVKIGKGVRIDTNVTITNSIIGSSVVILPGARIGQDGFGFATHQGKHRKIFHTGRVIIEDDVEIGSNTTIDRGALKDTIIRKGARLDNLVQVAHNVNIGEGSILVSQVGVAGSTHVGKYCAFGGQAGFAGHLKIADGVRVGGQAGVQHDIDEPGATYFGTPASPIRDWQKQNLAIKKLVKKEGK